LADRFLDQLEDLSATIGALHNSLKGGLDRQLVFRWQGFDHLLKLDQLDRNIIDRIFGGMGCIAHDVS
jgi:hypothetical protein